MCLRGNRTTGLLSPPSPPKPLYRHTVWLYQRKKMSQYHKKLKQEIRTLRLQTIALRRVRKEMEVNQ